MPQYYRPAKPALNEIEIKRSRFIAQAIPLSDIEQLHQLQDSLRSTHSRANHHCLAYVLGAPEKPLSAGSSDDGEPSGTAGKPMLNVLLKQNIGDVGVVVTRYFGGIKLGAGGLVRAYTQAVSELAKTLVLERVEQRIEISFSYPYTLESQIQALIAHSDLQLVSEHFDSAVHRRISVPESEQTQMLSSLRGLLHLGLEIDD